VARLLSVLIPARNEQFLAQTIANVLENARGDTEVIAVCDGCWPDPPVIDHPRVTILHYTESIGQRAATNAAARVSQAQFLMKLDAHCAVDEGFDVKLAATYEPDWTVIPRMYNLHAFDWVCRNNHRRYQGPVGPCETCGEPTTQEVVWKPRLARRTDFARFDTTLHFQYWRAYKDRPEAQASPIADTMTSVGAAWFMSRERFFALGGMDEAHGSWGQFGVEVACKAWLSGGRHVVNKSTWFAHMFRTKNVGFSFPYPIKDSQIEAARAYSRWLWAEGNWSLATRPLSWLVEKFAPVPDWHEAPVMATQDGGTDG
jgi:glycosyltransferase involved in cell wall biosynthesis